MSLFFDKQQKIKRLIKKIDDWVKSSIFDKYSEPFKSDMRRLEQRINMLVGIILLQNLSIFIINSKIHKITGCLSEIAKMESLVYEALAKTLKVIQTLM